MYLHLPKWANPGPDADTLQDDLSSPGMRSSAVDNTGDVLITAARAGMFNTIVEAVKIGRLESTLSSAGSFTVFAPTDEAFSRMPESILKALSEKPLAMHELLSAHIVLDRLSATSVKQRGYVKTMQGCKLLIENDDGFRVNSSRVIIEDIEASNGIIHAIDTVIFPQS